MYNPDNYLDPVLGTFLACQQIAFCSFVATWLCVLILPTLLADFQILNWKSSKGPRGWDIQLFNPFPICWFTLTYESLLKYTFVYMASKKLYIYGQCHILK